MNTATGHRLWVKNSCTAIWIEMMFTSKMVRGCERWAKMSDGEMKKNGSIGVNGNKNTHQMSQLSVLAANKWIAITSKVDKRADWKTTWCDQLKPQLEHTSHLSCIEISSIHFKMCSMNKHLSSRSFNGLHWMTLAKSDRHSQKKNQV